MWNNSDQLRCAAQSPLIMGMTIALLFSLGMCIVQLQSVWVILDCTKDFSISRQNRLSFRLARKARLCARCAIFFLKIKQILFSCRLVKGFYFWRDSKINSRCYWRCVLSWQVLFKQIEMGIIWRLCNNSETNIWLWKEWSLVVCSQNSFYVTRERKDDKNRQNAFFLC